MLERDDDERRDALDNGVAISTDKIHAETAFERLRTMNTGEILRAAATRVRQGWMQDSIGSDDGPNCAMGAVNVVRRGTSDYENCNEPPVPELADAVAVIVAALRLPPRESVPTDSAWRNVGAVTLWNNGYGQTAENVAAGLEYSALIWDQEQAIGVDGEQVEAVPVCTTK